MANTADYILAGQPHGDIARQLAEGGFDPGLFRPFIDEGGRKCVNFNTGHTVYNKEKGRFEPVIKKRLVRDVQNQGFNHSVYNATSLRRNEWELFDMAVLRAARQRLRAWSDVAAANTFGGFNGFANSMLLHEKMTDPGEAHVDMDGITMGNDDTPLMQLESLPLPITHADFGFSSRRLETSRKGGLPLDTTQAEAAGRRVAETVEKTLIGSLTGLTYGATPSGGAASTVRGYTNHPDRITKSDLTSPTATNSSTTVDEVLVMRQLAFDQNFFGPFILYHSTNWDRFLDDDYGVTSGTGYAFTPSQTLRQRIQQIEGIQAVRRLDFLTTDDTLLLVSMTPETVQAVIGMDLTTLRWEEKGGMQINFKVMAIMVPRIRSQFIGQSISSSKTGIVHGTS